jgi:hypothetical protein
MMIDKRSLHVKVQEHCDCFATAEPLREMAALAKESDSEEAALKWIALAVLHGIDRNAKSISLHRSAGGKLSVIAKYRESELPAPPEPVGGKIFDVARAIAHLDDRGRAPVVIGIRDGSIEIEVSLGGSDGVEEVMLKFPED